MVKRLILSNDQVNRYGFRVLTQGINLQAYERNPVLLYMHDREKTLPVGVMSDMRVEPDPDNPGDFQLTGLPVFDTGIGDDFAEMVAKKYEKGSLNAASVHLTPLEFSEDPDLLKPGQRGETISKSLLNEISIVVVPGNQGATKLSAPAPRLSTEDQVIALGASQEDVNKVVPLLKLQNSNSNKNDMKKIALALGLSGDATEEQILEQIEKSQDKGTEKALSMEKEKSANLVETLTAIALKAKDIEEDDKADFIALAEASPKLAAKMLDKALTFEAPKAEKKEETPGKTEQTQDKTLAALLESAAKSIPGATEKVLKYEELTEAQAKELKEKEPEKFEVLLNAYLDGIDPAGAGKAVKLN